MSFQLQTSALSITYEPASLSLTASVTGSDVSWSWAEGGLVRLANGNVLHLSNADCQSTPYHQGAVSGIRTVYRGLGQKEGAPVSFTVETMVGIDEDTSALCVQAVVNGDAAGEISALEFPPRMRFAAREGEGYTVLPRMQGTLVPAAHPITLEDGRIYYRDGYIPLFGQVERGCGYAAVYETPHDAYYALVGEEVQPYFVPSLGRLSYPRRMRFGFFAEGDFNTIAKFYRAYRRECGAFVTLKEKAARNPRVERLVGTPIIHTCAAVHIRPESIYYDAEHPENNDYVTTFATIAEQLRALSARGVDSAYVHIDGWGHHGYDNLHPSPFPISEVAGGAEGLRALEKTAHELGYLFAVHDNYLELYYDSPDFSFDNAVTLADGSHPYDSRWYGGPQTHLCAEVAPHFVRRNYNEFERLGISLDGAYLDEFSVVPPDECFHPNHPMTREMCAAARRRCFDLLTARGIIPSSEEVTDCVIDSMPLCHHAPFRCTDYYAPDQVNVGIPIPLFSLVFHECVVVPWRALRNTGGWGLACTDHGFVWALLCGGTIYYETEATEEDIAHGKIALELHRRVAHLELISHAILDEEGGARRSVFSDGTEVCGNVRTGEFTITYPDGRRVSGRD